MNLNQVKQMTKFGAEAATDIAGSVLGASPKIQAIKAGVKKTGKNFDRRTDYLFGKGIDNAKNTAAYAALVGKDVAKGLANPQNILQATAAGGVTKSAMLAGRKMFKKVGDGSPSIAAPLGYTLKKGPDTVLGLGLAGILAAQTANQVSTQQQIGKVEANGPLDQMSYDTGGSRSADLSATGDLVFALKNLSHRGRV